MGGKVEDAERVEEPLASLGWRQRVEAQRFGTALREGRDILSLRVVLQGAFEDAPQVRTAERDDGLPRLLDERIVRALGADDRVSFG